MNNKTDPLWKNDLTNNDSEGPLAGLRVVDFGQYLAGPLLAMMLADQGADVIRVDPPGGPRWNTPINATLLRGRRNIILDLQDPHDRQRAQALMAAADVVVENFRPGVAERLGIGQDTALSRAPQLVYCSLPGFSLHDPRAQVAAWEGVVMAAGGGYSLPSPTGESQAVFSPVPLASVTAAVEAATSVVAALIARHRDGLGQHIEVPLFNALFETSGRLGMTTERGPRVTLVDLGYGWYRCADDRYINNQSAWIRHTESFLRLAGRQSWLDEGLCDYEQLRTDPEAPLALRARLAELFRERPAHEWEALARENGLPMIMARSMTEWMAETQALASGTLVDTQDPVLGTARVPGPAVQLSTAPARIAAPRQLPGAANDVILPALDAWLASEGEVDASRQKVVAESSRSWEPPLAGIRVADFTRVLAGPTISRVLAQHGADVIKVDSLKSDPRAMTPPPFAHDYVNRGKRSLDIDLSDPNNRSFIQALLGQMDIIVQNFTPGVAERLGIDEATAKQQNPQVVYTYFNTYGLRGPWAGMRGYAELANTATGITERTIGSRELPSGISSLSLDLPRWPYTDYVTGIMGAFGALLGLYQRRMSDGAQVASVETSLVRATALEQIIYLIDYHGRNIPEPRGDATGWSPLQGLYETADGTVFIAARQEQQDTLLKAVGANGLAELVSSIKQMSVASLETAVNGLDIGLHRVETVTEAMKPMGIAHQLGIRLEDQTEEFGTTAMAGPIARLSRTSLVPGRFPRPFGAESEEIRAEILGTSR